MLPSSAPSNVYKYQVYIINSMWKLFNKIHNIIAKVYHIILSAKLPIDAHLFDSNKCLHLQYHAYFYVQQSNEHIQNSTKL